MFMKSNCYCVVFSVSHAEFKRLKETFKKVCPGHYMSREVFIREVLGENVPHAVAEVGITELYFAGSLLDMYISYLLLLQYLGSKIEANVSAVSSRLLVPK